MAHELSSPVRDTDHSQRITPTVQMHQPTDFVALLGCDWGAGAGLAGLTGVAVCIGIPVTPFWTDWTFCIAVPIAPSWAYALTIFLLTMVAPVKFSETNSIVNINATTNTAADSQEFR